MTPGWLRGWRKVLNIDFEKKEVHFLNCDDGTEEERIFRDTFSEFMQCYSLPASFGSSIGAAKDAEKPKVVPSSLSASELIDYLTEHRSEGDILSLCSELTVKLERDFYAHPEDVEKALRTFGDASMVARFNQIINTMRPSDLQLIIPDLIRRYLMRYS